MTQVGPSGTEQGTGGHCLERRCPEERGTCSPENGDASLSPQGRSLCESKARQVASSQSVGERATARDERTEIQEEVSDHQYTKKHFLKKNFFLINLTHSDLHTLQKSSISMYSKLTLPVQTPTKVFHFKCIGLVPTLQFHN